ncbi:hypothetical protein WOLCODRAFT_167361 [Wolfiporia cocos MD-104 SS10]|uniref:Uncharacterized protein n=1 Tax=Wolfiporia cocos (strain MD-104) TaxID=742152 RepID=A0A2H3J4L3_WOLCO|nr:hypothetical protein WOLCODRAFT_167361 [Wolfiporia cocos MD-104 SS10]
MPVHQHVHHTAGNDDAVKAELACACQMEAGFAPTPPANPARTLFPGPTRCLSPAPPHAPSSHSGVSQSKTSSASTCAGLRLPLFKLKVRAPHAIAAGDHAVARERLAVGRQRARVLAKASALLDLSPDDRHLEREARRERDRIVHVCVTERGSSPNARSFSPAQLNVGGDDDVPDLRSQVTHIGHICPRTPLAHLAYADWCVLARVCRVVRTSLEHERTLREGKERTERQITRRRERSTMRRGKGRDEGEREPLVLTLKGGGQDLYAYMRVVSTPVHQYAYHAAGGGDALKAGLARVPCIHPRRPPAARVGRGGGVFRPAPPANPARALSPGPTRRASRAPPPASSFRRGAP